MFFFVGLYYLLLKMFTKIIILLVSSALAEIFELTSKFKPKKALAGFQFNLIQFYILFHFFKAAVKLLEAALSIEKIFKKLSKL